MSETVRRYKSLSDIPAPSDEAIQRIAAIQDEDIDLSDMPELTDDFWENAEVGKFYRPRKQQITVKVDADILAWLKSGGRGYQTRLNAILRHVMLQKAGERRKEPQTASKTANSGK